MQAPGPTLETERLILRPPRREDFDGFVGLMSDPEAARYIGGVQPPAAVWRGVMAMAGAWTLEGFAMFSVIEKSSGRWIGRLGPWSPHGWPGTEVGWALISEAQGKGYALEGSSAAIDWAFNALGWEEVIHTIAPENRASRKLAQRLGSTLRGPGQLPAPFESFEVDVWGQSRDAWQARRHDTRSATSH